jgi:hypothetical protein
MDSDHYVTPRKKNSSRGPGSVPSCGKTSQEVSTFPVAAFFVVGDRVVIHWIFEFITHGGQCFLQDVRAFRSWHGDKDVKERFYYDPGHKKFARAQKLAVRRPECLLAGRRRYSCSGMNLRATPLLQ